MEHRHQRKLLEEVFGVSSSESEGGDEEENDCCPPIGNQSIDEKAGISLPNALSGFTWEPIHPVNGLWLCRDFLSPQQGSSLLSSIYNEGWFTDASHNQAMRFGELPLWAIKLSKRIHEALCFSDNGGVGTMDLDDKICILPMELLRRDPLFDQLIINLYQPGEGICAHVDLMRFEDGIALVSLESPCVMHFSPVEKYGQEVQEATKFPVYLTPGSLVIMWGDARYHWKHEINRKPGFQIWQGQEITQKRRTSITLRKLRLCQ